MESNFGLVLSSLTFIFPTVITAYNGHLLSTTSNMIVLCTSTMYHMTKNQYILQYDLIACNINAIVSLYYCITYRKFLILWVLLYCLFVYHYGYHNKSLIWSDNYYEATLWHASMHIVSAFGTVMASNSLTN